MIAARGEFQAGGAFSAQGIASLYGTSAKRLTWMDGYITSVLILLAASSAATTALGPYSVPGRIAVLICLVTRTVVRWRRLLGGDGAEQITSLSLAATAMAVLPSSSPARIKLAVAFVAAQLILSYVTAGIAKLISPVWRDGNALPSIMATDFHGHPAMVSTLRRWRPLPTLLGWFVIVFECGFPVFLTGPPALVTAALATGLAFHVICAVTMGLNNFLLAFPATYPCVLVAGAWLSQFY